MKLFIIVRISGRKVLVFNAFGKTHLICKHYWKYYGNQNIDPVVYLLGKEPTPLTF